MIIAISSAVLALFSLFLTLFMRKMQETEKPLRYVSLNTACLIGIIVLSAVSQISASKDSEEYKQAVLELEVLAKINEHMIPVNKFIARIINNYDIVQQFISYEHARLANSDASALLIQQQEKITTQPSFQTVKKALAELHDIAATIQSLHMQYPKLVPEETLEWSSVTLKIKMSNLNQYLDPYDRHDGEVSESVIRYIEHTGKAFGVSVKKVRELSNKVISP
ncbi:hypothetical protein [Pseudoalteromonas sp. NCCP-2140]|uniref:hypothetical protein n=1 Tax=Pseudoalteromonas sp. NCCP-2140 TaxID=2942288 RepID=UPI00203E7EF0|nr:hypothetical protein [Pseudoalteromonas sp. NCCP-2140]